MNYPLSQVSLQKEDREKGHEIEEKILQFSGLKLNEELFVYDVEITLKGKNHKIHTYRCGDGNAEDLVLLHGYGGSSVLYYGMLKELSKKFRVFCLDFIGMGLSSKDKFECKSTEETLDFFIGSIERWREKVGLQKFYLVGHSLGGYISGQYTLRHQERVKRLTLLSPAGITNHKEEPTIEDAKKRLGFFKKMFYGIFIDAWEKKMTPFKFLKEYPWLGKIFLGKYVQSKFNVRGEEAELLKDYLLAVLTQPHGTQEAIHYLLKPPVAGAFIPLEDYIVKEMNLPVDCFYGEFDPMDSTGARRIQEMNKKKNYTFKVLPKSAHQLPMEVPKALVEHIVLGVGVAV